MDGFTYTNIFDTKGIEYLAIIAFLVLLIPFWIMLNKNAPLKARVKRVLGALSAGLLNIPQGIFFSRNHTWSFMERSGTARVGLDDLLVRMTGDMGFTNVKQPGDQVRKGELLAEFTQDGKRLRIFSPLTGKVKAVNETLAGEPSLLSDDPYGKGWLFRIEPADWKGDTAPCHIAANATEWFRGEVDRVRDFMAVTLPKYSKDHAALVLQDGGELSDRALAGLPEEIWTEFQREFLDP